VKVSPQSLVFFIISIIAIGLFLVASALMASAGFMLGIDPTEETYYQMMGTFMGGMSTFVSGISVLTVAVMLYVLLHKKQ